MFNLTKKYFLILVFLFTSCATEKYRNSTLFEYKNTNNVTDFGLAFKNIDHSIKIEQKMNDIYDLINQAKKLGLNRIFLLNGIYNQTYYPIEQWDIQLDEIVQNLRQDGYLVYPYYRDNYGEIMKTMPTSIGLEVVFP